MKLWLISQTANDEYDTFDSAVVVAATEEAARRIHPRGYRWVDDAWRQGERMEERYSTWAGPSDVAVKHIGRAADGLTEGEIVCASFNAG